MNDHAATAVLDSYRSRTEDLDDYLGRVAICSQRDAKMPFGDLVAVLTDAGLTDFVPRERADVDVFRTVCTKRAKAKVELPDKRTANVLVRPLSDDEHALVRQVVVETLDSNGQRLDYEPVANVAFDRVTNRAVRTYLDGVPTPLPQVVEDIIDGILADYRDGRGVVDSDGLRALALKILEAQHGVSLRSTGSVYFVPKDHCGPVVRLAQAAKKVPGMQVDLLALIDEGDGDQKDMVRRAADDAVSKEAHAILSEIKASRQEGGTPIGKRRMGTMLTQLRQLKARAAAHEELLERQLDESAILLAQLEHTLVGSLAAADAA